MSLANVSIVGNLAREPMKHQFSSGRVKTTLVVAVTKFNWTRKEKETDFYRVETWDRLAELALNYLKKGNQVAVSGRLVMQKWVDREGKDRLTPTVQANQLSFPPRYRPAAESELPNQAPEQSQAEKIHGKETVEDIALGEEELEANVSEFPTVSEEFDAIDLADQQKQPA